jgi:LysR family transcriptional activator of nhaA
MPGVHAVVRSHIDRWLDDQRLTPRLMGEFDDGSLMKAFGQAGAGFFPVACRATDQPPGNHDGHGVGATGDIPRR